MIDAQVVGDAVEKGAQIADLAPFTVHQAYEGILQQVAGGFPATHAAGQERQQFAAVTLIEQR
ncbi:hypothetical protein D3C79_906520 [compost metagenome]